MHMGPHKVHRRAAGWEPVVYAVSLQHCIVGTEAGVRAVHAIAL
jgi:hypothetical protein